MSINQMLLQVQSNIGTMNDLLQNNFNNYQGRAFQTALRSANNLMATVYGQIPSDPNASELNNTWLPQVQSFVNQGQPVEASRALSTCVSLCQQLLVSYPSAAA
jgi:hypothetical protein